MDRASSWLGDVGRSFCAAFVAYAAIGGLGILLFLVVRRLKPEICRHRLSIPALLDPRGAMSWIGVRYWYRHSRIAAWGFGLTYAGQVVVLSVQLIAPIATP